MRKIILIALAIILIIGCNKPLQKINDTDNDTHLILSCTKKEDRPRCNESIESTMASDCESGQLVLCECIEDLCFWHS